ncbi:MAG TPA: TonB-dependent receptor, partial [Pseudoxanthomonas sp.]|nr:TonB-dependent receptor [Pseudoxanthomonas sp.]
LDPYVANSQRSEQLGTDREVYGATLLGNFSLSDNWSVSTITGWRRYDGLDKFDSDGSQADLIEFDEHAWGDQFSQEFRFNFDNGGAFTGFVGASFFDEKASRDLLYQTDERQLYALLSPRANAIFPFLPIVPLLNPDGTPNTSQESLVGGLVPLNPNHYETFGNDVKITSTEIFADGTWKFADRWSLTMGVRGTHEKVAYGYHAEEGNFSSIGYFLSANTIPNCYPLLAAPCYNVLYNPTDGRIARGDSWNSWVGRAVLGWQFNDDVNAYASISRGRRPNMIDIQFRALDENGDNVPDGPPVEVIKEIPAEILMSYELGVKGAAANGRLAYDVSLYYYDYANFQASIANDNPPPDYVTINAGRAHSLGVEASLFARFNDRLSGFLNYSHIEAGFNAFDKDGTYQELAGNEFRMTPKDSVAIGLDWNLPLSSGRSIFVRPSYNWRSHVFFEDSNEPDPQTGLTMEEDGYGLINLRAGMRFNDRWDVTVWGNNLSDRKYIVDAGNTGLIFGIPTLIAGASRMYGVTLTGKF